MDFLEDELTGMKDITDLGLEQEKQAGEHTRTWHCPECEIAHNVKVACMQQSQADDVGELQQQAPGKGSHWPRQVTLPIGGGMSFVYLASSACFIL